MYPDATDPMLDPESDPDRLPFGPYAGQDLASVAVIDPDYLLGLVREGVGPPTLRAEAARALAARGRLASRGAVGGADEQTQGAEPSRASAAGAGSPSGRPPAWALALAIGLLGVVAVLLWSREAALDAGEPGQRRVPVAEAREAGGVGAPQARSTADRGRSRGVSGTASAAVSAGTTANPTAMPPPGTPLPCGARVPGAIPASAAGDFVDTYQAVEFEVVKTKDTGKVTFLNSHEPYQGHFYVAIFPTDYALYPEPPALYFRGKCIVVQGTIELYRGVPQMVLRGPDDVRVVDAAVPLPTGTLP